MLTYPKWMIYFSMILVSSFSTTLVARTLVTKKNSAKIYKSPKKKPPSLVTLKKGEILNKIGPRKGAYWHVSYAQEKTNTKIEGFIHFRSARLQRSKSSGIVKAITKDIQKNRNTTVDEPSLVRTRSAVMGVRGLSTSDDIDFAGNVRPNLRMVYTMEGITVSNKAIKAISKLVEQENDLLEK